MPSSLVYKISPWCAAAWLTHLKRCTLYEIIYMYHFSVVVSELLVKLYVMLARLNWGARDAWSNEPHIMSGNYMCFVGPWPPFIISLPYGHLHVHFVYTHPHTHTLLGDASVRSWYHYRSERGDSDQGWWLQGTRQDQEHPHCNRVRGHTISWNWRKLSVVSTNPDRHWVGFPFWCTVLALQVTCQEK